MAIKLDQRMIYKNIRTKQMAGVTNAFDEFFIKEQFDTVIDWLKPIKNKIPIKPPPPRNPFKTKELKLVPSDIDEINIKAETATKSCIIKTPIEIFP